MHPLATATREAAVKQRYALRRQTRPTALRDVTRRQTRLLGFATLRDHEPITKNIFICDTRFARESLTRQ